MRGRTWVGLLGALALVAACSTGPTPTAPEERSSSRPSAAASDAASPQTSRARGKKAPDNFCKADRPADWTKAEKEGKLPQQDGESIRAAAVAADGSRVFSIIDTSDTSSLVMDAGGKRTKVFAVEDMEKSQLGTVRFDGRWLVFEHLLGFDIDATWELYAWDTRHPKAKPERFAKRAKGSPTVGFFRFDVEEGRVTWMQPRTFEKRDIHLYDLKSAKDRVIKKKMIFGPMLSNGSLIWQQEGADKVVRLTGVEVDSEKEVEIPEQVQAAGGSFDLVTDGTTWAWSSPDFSKLHAWRDGWETSVKVRDEGAGNHFQYLALSGGLLTFADDHATFAADLEQHTYSQLTKSYGGAVAQGDTIAVNLPAGKGQTASVVDSSQLSRLPDCDTWPSR